MTTQDHDESHAPKEEDTPPSDPRETDIATPPRKRRGAASDEEVDEDAVRETPRWREFVPPGGNGPLFDPEGLLFGEPAT